MISSGINLSKTFAAQLSKSEKTKDSTKSEQGAFADLFNPKSNTNAEKVSSKLINSTNTEKAPTKSPNVKDNVELTSQNSSQDADTEIEQPQDVQEYSQNNENPAAPIYDPKVPTDNKLAPIQQEPSSPTEVVNQYNQQKVDELKVENNPMEALTHRIAMKNFLFKMKNELNIAPEELIQAFGKLSVEELLSPPEDSLEAILGQLDLNQEEKTKARTYFHEMLKQTASTSMADFLKESNSDLSIKVLSKKELQNQKIQDAVLKMNSQFFVDPKKSEENDKTMAKGTSATAAGGTATKNISEGQLRNSATQNLSVEKKGMFDISGFQPVQTGEMSEVSQLMAQDTSALSQPPAKEGVKSLPSLNNLQIPNQQMSVQNIASNKIAENALIPADVTGFNPMDNAILQSSQAPTQKLLDMATSTTPGESIEGSHQLGLAAFAQSDAAATKDDEQAAQDGEGDTYYTQVKVGENQPTNTQNKEFVINPRPQATAADEAANVREVINQARLMVTKGGGEMKVHMSPHGLGEVTMKVNVENGNVNVEMLADTHDAKKIIEKGISELKATLAAHKLNVENIKVDTSSNLMSDLSDKQQDAERQFAQQFLGEFHRNNESWRNNFYDITGARAYKSQTQEDAENPLLQASGYERGRKAQSRLDLVA